MIPYRIRSIERVDGASLKTPPPAGYARYIALIDFWPAGEANGPPAITDELVFEIPTQIARPAAGDPHNWTLATKEDSLAFCLVAQIETLAPAYAKQIADGVRGFRGDPVADQHGTTKPNDPAAYHPKLRALLNRIKRPA